MKEYSIFSKAPRLEPRRLMQFSVMPRKLGFVWGRGAVCVSLCANAIEKYMYPSVLSLAIRKLKDRLSSLALVRQPV